MSSKRWTREENLVLRMAIMNWKFGNWTKMYKSYILPGKNITQLYIQTQRILKLINYILKNLN
jgi:hypothetical protein